MLTRSKKPWDLPYSEVTPEGAYHSRRDFIKVAAAGTVGAVAASVLGRADASQTPQGLAALPNVKQTSFVPDPKVDPTNTYEQITNYNNYYEFGTGKSDPAHYAGRLTTRPWTVKIDGMVGKPGGYGVEDLIRLQPARGAHLSPSLRRRLVDGGPLGGLPAQDAHRHSAADLAGEVRRVHDADARERDAGPADGRLPFPYVEGLRLDEAMHPLTLDGRRPLRQGAAESERRAAPRSRAVEVRVQERQVDRAHSSSPTSSRTTRGPCRRPTSTASTPTSIRPWTTRAGARRPSGASASCSKRKTLMFNGYGDQVASLYAGMDLRKNF